MNRDDLLTLLKYFDQSETAYLKYVGPEDQIEISKEVPNFLPAYPNDQAHSGLATVKEVSNFQIKEEQASLEAKLEEEAGKAYEKVQAPLVGVAYLQASPEDDCFVKVGDQVEAGQVLMIIEAMKLMNEIQAPVSGRIAEICVENESVVEFGQTLVKIQV